MSSPTRCSSRVGRVAPAHTKSTRAAHARMRQHSWQLDPTRAHARTHPRNACSRKPAGPDLLQCDSKRARSRREPRMRAPGPLTGAWCRTPLCLAPPGHQLAHPQMTANSTVCRAQTSKCCQARGWASHGYQRQVWLHRQACSSAHRRCCRWLQCSAPKQRCRPGGDRRFFDARICASFRTIANVLPV